MIEFSYNYVATYPILSRTHAYPGRPSCDRRVENAVGGSRPNTIFHHQNGKTPTKHPWHPSPSNLKLGWTRYRLLCHLCKRYQETNIHTHHTSVILEHNMRITCHKHDRNHVTKVSNCHNHNRSNMRDWWRPIACTYRTPSPSHFSPHRHQLDLTRNIHSPRSHLRHLGCDYVML